MVCYVRVYRAWVFEGFETSPTRGRKPIGIDTATLIPQPRLKQGFNYCV